jgi:polysaccharide export outer membrane protein
MAAASIVVLSGMAPGTAQAQSRPELDALVYGGAGQPAPAAPQVITQAPAAPATGGRGLFTSSSAARSSSPGALSALTGVFNRTPRATQMAPMNAQAAMPQAAPAQAQMPGPTQMQQTYQTPIETPPMADASAQPRRRGLLTGGGTRVSSTGALAALGRGFPSRRSSAQPMPVRYGPPIVAVPYDPAYRVDTGDRLRIVVYGQDGLTNTYQIAPSGAINMPLINTVPARGRTPAELASVITARLRDGFIREPSVSVEIEAYRPFFILGEVAAPGQYPYVPNMSVESAIAIAGGFSPRAKRDAVTLTHPMPDGMVRAIVPVSTALSPGDTIMVGERWF